MTVEMGDRDVELNILQRVAGASAAVCARGFSLALDDLSLRFNAATATLSVSGESEHAGDRYSRGLLVGLFYLTHILLWLFPLSLASRVPVPESPALALVSPAGPTVLFDEPEMVER